MSEAVREMLTAWKHYLVIAEEFTDVDAAHVLVILRADGRGRISAIQHTDVVSTRRGAAVVRVRSDRMTGVDADWDRDRAFVDLGLAADDGSPNRRKPRTARDIRR
jgi:hypothetical protein